MKTVDDGYEGVKSRYRLEEWREAAGSMAVHSFLPELAQHHALSLESRVPIGRPGSFSEHYVGKDDPDVRVLVDIAPHPTVAEARDALVQELARSSAPKLPSCEERGLSIGDVGFCGFGDPLMAILFVRQNVLVDVRSVGKTPVAVADIAKSIDAQLSALSGVDHPSTLFSKGTATAVQYADLFSRDNFGDTGIIPSTGNPYQSPDIIPLQSGTLGWPQVQTSYNGPDIGLSVLNGGVNNIYVRSMNLNQQAASSGTVNLYYSKASVFLIPTSWTPISGPSGQGSLPLVDSTSGTTIAQRALAITSPAFLLSGLPPASNDHYCLISVIQTPTHPVTVPPTFPSNAAFAQWVQDSPAVAWRNLSVVPNGQTQIVRAFQFGSTNPTGAYFYFSFTARDYPTGTGITVQCTDMSNPIQWSGSLPAPDMNGNQITGFQNWVIANFSGAVVVTLTSLGGAFPSGATLKFRYYQVPDNSDALHRAVGRFVEVAQVHETLGPQKFMAFLIPLGECTLIVQ